MSNSSIGTRAARTLTYRIHRIPNYYQAAAVSFLFILGVTFLTFRNYITESETSLSTFELITIGIGSIIFIGATALLFLRQAKTLVHVQENTITIEYKGEKEVIAITDIEKVNLNKSIKGGCEVTLKNGKVYKFPMWLERSEYILDVIRKAKPHLISDSEFVSYRVAAIITDHSWARIFDRILNIKKIVFKYFIISSILTAALVYVLKGLQIDISLSMLTIIVYLGVLIVSVTIGNLIVNVTEYIIVQDAKSKMEADPNFRVRDMALEKRYERIGDYFHIIAMSVLSLFVAYLTSF